jgi:CubicO group peptidase (beta-lactamase class C family)
LQSLKSSYVPYNEILKQEIISTAKLESFSETRPSTAHYDAKDPNAYVYGGPAGGYWITVKDLDKFGQWICQLYKQDKQVSVDSENSLPQLFEKYGGEFYGGGVVEHNGAVPSSSGHFAAFLNHGVSVAILSDQSRLRGNFAADGL